MTETLAALVQPWADLYAGSVLIEGSIVFLHLGALVVAGGLAIAMDRAIVRGAAAGSETRGHLLRELASAHGLVIAGLVVLVITGLLMLLADVEALVPSWLFWVKMGLFGLLLWNGLVLRRAQHRVSGLPEDTGGWRPLRAAAVRSSVLWLLLLLVGSVLPLVA